MINTVQDLKHLKGSPITAQDRASIDRSRYLDGRQGYPTGLDEGALEGLSERCRACYMMGYSVSEWEDENNELLQEVPHS